MVSFLNKHFTISGKEASVCFLAFLWCFSLSAGVFSGSKTELYFSLMPGNHLGVMSIVAVLLIRLLPLIVSIIAIRLKASFIIYLTASIRGFCYGFLLSIFLVHFKTAGWLFWSLEFITCCVLDVVLIIIWINSFLFGRSHTNHLALVYLICTFICVYADHSIIAPLITKLITYY